MVTVLDAATNQQFMATSTVSTEVALVRAFAMARAGGLPELCEVCDRIDLHAKQVAESSDILAPEFIFCVLPADQAFGPDYSSIIRSCILVAEASYWKEHGCLDDHHLSRKLPVAVRDLIGEVMESVFESCKSPEEIRHDLESLGLKHSESMQKANNTAYFW